MSTLLDNQRVSSSAQSEHTETGTLNGDDVPDVLDESMKVRETSGWDSPAPDGGAEAWLAVLGAWCVTFCSFGWINSK